MHLHATQIAPIMVNKSFLHSNYKTFMQCSVLVLINHCYKRLVSLLFPQGDKVTKGNVTSSSEDFSRNVCLLPSSPQQGAVQKRIKLSDALVGRTSTPRFFPAFSKLIEAADGTVRSRSAEIQVRIVQQDSGGKQVQDSDDSHLSHFIYLFIQQYSDFCTHSIIHLSIISFRCINLFITYCSGQFDQAVKVKSKKG